VAKLTGNHEIDIWGDGEQTRSFCHIDDCVLGIYKLMRSDYHEPLNLGQDRMVTINQLADMIADIRRSANQQEARTGAAGRARAQLR
jgi:nucleoside-diphosphate-sugar epimerase